MTTKIPVSETGFCNETRSRCRKNLCCVSAKVVPNHLLHLCYDHFEFVLQRKHRITNSIRITGSIIDPVSCSCGWFGNGNHFREHIRHSHNDDGFHENCEECREMRGRVKT